MPITNIPPYSAVITISPAKFSYQEECDNTYSYLSFEIENEIETKIDIDHSHTQLEDFILMSIPKDVSDNIETLRKHFNKEIAKKKLEKDSKEAKEAYDVFSTTSSYIAELPFEKVVIELTKSRSIKYTLVFTDNKVMMISKPFDKLEDVDTNQVIFSIFQGRELLLSHVSDISELVSSFKELLYLQVSQN